MRKTPEVLGEKKNKLQQPWLKRMQIFGGVFRVSRPPLFVDVGAINSGHVKGKVSSNNKSIKLPSSASNPAMKTSPKATFPNSAASWF